MRILQYRTSEGERHVAVRRDGEYRELRGYATTLALAQQAIEQGMTIAAMLERVEMGPPVDAAMLHDTGHLLCPIDHPEPSRLRVTGTGLTHLGSAEMRGRMSSAAEQDLTDSMKMYRAGVANGRPPSGQAGIEPEWFYKGNGDCLVPSGQPLESPGFAYAAGEEPEVAGVYLAGPDGTVWRLGFALANDFSDHTLEERNYLYVAPSKLRQCALGPELLVGNLPADVRGASRIWRGGQIVWEREFATGEANMSHTIANLEHHHFKHEAFRRPGDVHVHLFGTATFSYGDGFRTQEGDMFQFVSPPFGLPLTNTLHFEAPGPVVAVRSL